MDEMTLIAVIDAAAREATLFAAIWFLAGGLDDLAVDLIYAARRIRSWLRMAGMPSPEDTPPPGRIVGGQYPQVTERRDLPGFGGTSWAKDRRKTVLFELRCAA